MCSGRCSRRLLLRGHRGRARGPAWPASEAGELDAGSDPAQLAFELTTLLAGTNIVTALHDDDAAIDHARRAVAARRSTGLSGGPSVANWTRPGSRAEGGA